MARLCLPTAEAGDLKGSYDPRHGGYVPLDGVPALGISVFAAFDDIGAPSLDGILAGKLSTYHVVHLTTAGDLQSAGFTLLPTFGRPYMTLLLKTMGQVEPLLDLLGPARPNPRHGEMTGRRRR